MKKKIERTIIIILLLGTFSIIFGFSSQNGEKSGRLSSNISKVVIERLPVENTEQNLKKAEAVIRKVAHFSIYTVVGFLLVALFNTYQLKENRKNLISFLIGFLYATSDEIHQRFISGRSGRISDVILDSMGVVLGILLFLMISKIYKKIKINQQNLAKN